MTIAVFLLSLIAAMALGMPIAYALIVCGIALMAHLDIFDSQIIAQNIINGADSFPLMAVPFFLLAGEIMNVVVPDMLQNALTGKMTVSAAADNAARQIKDLLTL